jgi:hypothetical protein
MCYSPGPPPPFEWRKEPPQEPGDYLWLVQWDCGCVLDSGIAWATRVHSEDGSLEISWEGNPPKGWDGDYSIIDYWARITLPMSRDASRWEAITNTGATNAP